jgi:hypothetical protein
MLALQLSHARGDRRQKYGMFQARRSGGIGVDTPARSTCVGPFGLGAAEEVQAWIGEHKGHPFIELHRHQHAAPGESPPSDAVIRMPVTLLPELKRLVHGVEQHLTAQGLSDEGHTVEPWHADRGPMFAHPTEAEFARLLGFYTIRWPYEPTTFPWPWEAHGRVLESCTPDVYLPEQARSLELTPQKQGLVTKKNRKVRLLRQRYPEVNIRLFYRRDVERLRQKYEGPTAQKNPGPLLTS